MLKTNLETGQVLCCNARAAPVDIYCKGSLCMGWRWAYKEPTGTGYRELIMRCVKKDVCSACEGLGKILGVVGDTEPEHSCGECEGTGKVNQWEPLGFCGLAGEPINRW